MTRGWVINGDEWGVNKCNNFSTDIGYNSHRDCGSGIPENDPTHCFTHFESFEQADFSGVKEFRGCDSDYSKGKFQA